MERLTNRLPEAGGATMLIEGASRYGDIIHTALLAVVGAVVGWLVKIILDYLYKRYIKKILK